MCLVPGLLSSSLVVHLGSRYPLKKKQTDVAAPGESLPANLGETPLSPAQEAAGSDVDAGADNENFPIVGIGGSAGGLAAFQAFFAGLPNEVGVGIAVVLVQHLAPDHKSILAELLRPYTQMKVIEVTDGVQVRPNCAYIIQPNCDLALINGRLQVFEPAASRGHRLPIDFFFRSLAQDQRERAIGVVLSGSGSDGTQGVRAIKGEGGMVMAQSLDSTEYDGMPRSAIATRMVDFELLPDKMGAQIGGYIASAFRKLRPEVASPQLTSALHKLFALVRGQTGHDFSQYKLSTARRRVERRMAVHQHESMDDYVRYVQQTPVEAVALFQDMLIGVTSFFRDPEAFHALEEHVIPSLFTSRPLGGAIRVWVAGCSTGEEAYSIAMLLTEHEETLQASFKLQVFATDIDGRSIDVARAGHYPASIAADISPERLQRFFTLEKGLGTGNPSRYRVRKPIRDLLIFSEQDVIKDPPFSKLDLISCRNLMIYLGSELQRRLIPLFHYSIAPGGFLFLGTSETVGDYGELFDLTDRKLKVYRRKEYLPGGDRSLIARFAMTRAPIAAALPGVPITRKAPTLRSKAEKTILEHAVPAAALVDGSGSILYLHGRTGMYLEPAPGEAGVNNIIKMARTGLERELKTGLRKAVGGEVARYFGLQVKTNGDRTAVDLVVRPVAGEPGSQTERPLFLVTLAPTPIDDLKKQALMFAGAQGSRSDVGHADRIAELEQGLRINEEFLQTTTEELENSNEELRSSSEEMQSVNEELQSTNEELETSKEELQSVNEELSTVNSELESKLIDLSRANNDMNNLLAGTGIATIFIDTQLNILRFTPTAKAIINLIPGDVGRPVSHIASNLLDNPDLIQDATSVLDSLIPVTRDVRTNAGGWFTMRILPYRTLENVIEGVVLTFTDVRATRLAEAALRVTAERMRAALKASSVVVFNQDLDLRYIWVDNPDPAFNSASLIGKTDHDLFPKEQADKLAAIKNAVLGTGKGTQQRVELTLKGVVLDFELTVEPLLDEGGRVAGLTCASTQLSDLSATDSEARANDGGRP
ncbi:MAG: two-component system CheB/CheR fusion protein [Planctomycetota bacterium]